MYLTILNCFFEPGVCLALLGFVKDLMGDFKWQIVGAEPQFNHRHLYLDSSGVICTLIHPRN